MRTTGTLFFLMIMLIACDKAPEYPSHPTIRFEKIQRFVVRNQYTLSHTDSIVVTLWFEDGDGDLGLSDQDIYYPYQAYDFVWDDDGNIVKLSSNAGEERYNPCYYIIGDYDTGGARDTFRVNYNNNHFNFFVDLWIKEGRTFKKFDTCYSSLNGRFPVLNPVKYDGPVDGELTFTISDQPWLSEIMAGKTGKFAIYIQDRALHRSNVVETPEIQFNY